MGREGDKGGVESPWAQFSSEIPTDFQFFNRELSWLHFNARVLRQAAEKKLPLLERLFFLSIFESNLDEFFMKRVGGLKRHLAVGMPQTSLDGLSVKEQLRAIRQLLLPQLKKADRIYLEELCPLLREEGIFLLSWEELSASERRYCRKYFDERIFPLLTPLAVDAGHPFPFLSNLSTSVGVALSHPDREDPLFARVKTSGIEPQWVRLPTEKGGGAPEEYRFLPAWQVVFQFVDELFSDMTVVGKMLFRVTRNIEIEVDEEDVEDLRELMEEELRQRKKGMMCRLEHGKNPDPWILQFLIDELDLHAHDIYDFEGECDYRNLSEICALDLPTLKFAPWTPTTPVSLREETSMFSALRTHDLLVHHPFESFSASVERFVREAVEDPAVRSIKMTVYRVGDSTPIIPLLIQAAELGKNVVCVVELKARFDEQRNIGWAHQLEEAGVHVIYGMYGVKIHAKTLLVVRQEEGRVRCYAHIATGNYHAGTANLYTDFGLFTAKESYTRELLHFFNFLTGRSRKEDYEKLLVAPFQMAKRFIELIEGEIQHAGAGRPAHIVAKMNSLEDREIITALYEASQAGVQIELYVRGVCCLRPGVKGLSENIRVISIIGRLLEHSRLFYFRNGAEDPIDGVFFLSSADWMQRNLHRRIEVAAPLEERAHRERVWGLFQVLRHDEVLRWELLSDGSYQRGKDAGAIGRGGTHEVLMRRAKELSAVKA
ncbi:polyphosphate kinase 1 [bacterium]|nr:polyphosphate kinase 1 [bacterium]